MSNHFDAQGRAHMVNVSHKDTSHRCAVAEAWVRMAPATLQALHSGNLAKGDVLGVARLAGIQAAKRTAELIPLAHPVTLHHVHVSFDLVSYNDGVAIRAQVEALDRTGVEMEAMTAVSVAGLTIYDMVKGLDRGVSLEQTQLIYKDGGRSGCWRREAHHDSSHFDS